MRNLCRFLQKSYQFLDRPTSVTDFTFFGPVHLSEADIVAIRYEYRVVPEASVSHSTLGDTPFYDTLEEVRIPVEV